MIFGDPITLTGDSEFYEDIVRCAKNAMYNGYIVLTEYFPGAALINILELQKKRIDMSDCLLVVNKSDKFSDYVKEQIDYAQSKNKPVYYVYGSCKGDCILNSLEQNCPAYTKIPVFRKKFEGSYMPCPFYKNK